MKNINLSLIIVISLFFITLVNSRTIYVGSDLQIKTLQSASAIAGPGDIIIIKNGTYFNRENIINLNGSQNNPIIIHAEDEGKVIYSGQSEAWHLSSCSYLYITGIIFEKQSANGVNIDDSGNLYGSAHHITLKNCTFRNMNASGNNDLLKLSGLDEFLIENCIFSGGSAGGSGIDMVGCHKGKIISNRFENLGSSGIQAKGGSQFIEILQNKFINAGNRALNLGGSTGLAYFRPLDAKFEAADILLQSNVFTGSWSPVAFVGCTRVKVINNTIFKPSNWVLRILQETVDPSRFIACGNNEFSNNIIYFGNNLSRIVNTGPYTAPETFIFSNNLWFNYQNVNFNDPMLPVSETNGIIQKNPLFIDSEKDNFELAVNSPATGKGKKISNDKLDHKYRFFNDPRSIGAFESQGIFKDFSGLIDYIWYYKYDLGYIRNIIADKSAQGNREFSDIDLYMFIGDVSNKTKFKMHTSHGITNIIKNNYYNDPFNTDFHYNFNLLSGDTLFNKQEGFSFDMLIDSVRHQYVAGEVRKTQHLHKISSGTQNNSTSPPLVFIEGIFAVSNYLTINEYYDSIYLRCFITHDSTGNEIITEFSNDSCDKVTLKTQFTDLSNLKISPNPANEYIYLEFEKANSGLIQILNISGKLLKSHSIQNTDNLEIDLSNFTEGLYIVKFSNSGFVYTGKLSIIK